MHPLAPTVRQFHEATHLDNWLGQAVLSVADQLQITGLPSNPADSPPSSEPPNLKGGTAPALVDI